MKIIISQRKKEKLTFYTTPHFETIVTQPSELCIADFQIGNTNN